MMRLLHVSITIAASAVLLATCDAGTGSESAASRARDSSLAHDLRLAADTSLAGHGSPRDTGDVSESDGTLDSATAMDSTPAGGAARASSTIDVSSRAAASAEGYVGPSCASAAPDDQQRCLVGYLAKSDVLLDRYYEALILRLKSEAGVTSSAAEPSSVQRLRTAQRAWLVYRDDECRKRTREREGPLWAPVRAQCLAAYSALRARELGDALARRRALAPREPAKPARPKAHATRRARSRRG